MKPIVFIAISMYDQIWPEVVDCVTHSATRTIYGPGTRIRTSSIDLGRSDLTGRFLEWRGPEGEQATHMMCVDTDTWWQGDLITRLVKADRDIVCAAYRARVYPFGFFMIYPPNTLSLSGCRTQALSCTDTSHPKYCGCMTLVELHHTGIGATLIRRNVIEKMCEDYRSELQYTSVELSDAATRRTDDWYTVPHNVKASRVHLFQKCLMPLENEIRAFGEDYSFQWRARKSGFKLECLADVTTYHAGIQGNLKREIMDTGAM